MIKNHLLTLIHSFNKTKTEAIKNKKFSFSNYADDFDNHIHQSIRGYPDLRNDVISMSKYFIENDTYVIDLGCSQGTLLKKIYEYNTQIKNTHYIGIEINERFKKFWNNEKNLNYQVNNIIHMDFPSNLSLVTSLFTMQFISEKDRMLLLNKIYHNLIEGGAFLFSEKLLSNSGKIQNMMDFIYYDYKKQFFSEKEILDKETELRHLAKLTNEEKINQQLKEVGFRYFQTFWRNFNFAGFIAIK